MRFPSASASVERSPLSGISARAPQIDFVRQRSTPRPDLPDGIQAIYGEISRRKFASIDAANAFLQRRMQEYNNAPQPELGGLSPLQVGPLLDDPWDGSGPLRIADDIPAQTFEQFDALGVLNARMLLDAVQTYGPIRLTPSGYLNRAFVSRMLDTLRWWPGYLDRVRTFCKVINEYDVTPLLQARDHLVAAKLLRPVGRELRITPAGREAAAPEAMGTLAARLFRLTYRELAFDQVDDEPEFAAPIQHLMPLLLWKLSRIHEGWWTMEELVEEIPTPELRRQYEGDDLYFNPGMFEYLLKDWVFDGLADWGILEVDLDSWDAASQRYRRTPLFERFLSWDPGALPTA